MRVLVCGSRDLVATPEVMAWMAEYIHPWDVVIVGGAPGADKIAEGFARGLGCEVHVFRADWKAHGKAAGPMRNKRMLTEGKPELVVAFPGGPGTADMKRIARDAGVKVVEVKL